MRAVRIIRGFSLLEVLLSTVLITAILGMLASVYIAVLKGFAGQGSRYGTAAERERAITTIVGDLRRAKVVAVPQLNEIRFSTDGSAFKVYYLDCAQSGCRLRRTALSGGVNGTFVSGQGETVLRDLAASPETAFGVDSAYVTLRVAVGEDGGTDRWETRVCPRNR